MTTRRLLIAITAAAAILATWSWWHSDRREIARQVAELEELVSKTGSESALEGMGRAREITTLFATAFQIRARQLGFGTSDRQELIRFVHSYRSRWDSISMRVSTTLLDVAPEHRRATQMASVEFLSGDPGGGGAETYRVQINWLEHNGAWLIDYVDVLEIVERTGF